MYVLDVESGELIEGPIDRARYSPIAWLLDGASYYYVRRLPPEQVPQGEEQFHRRVWLHKVGDDPDNDVLIFGENRKGNRVLRSWGKPRRALVDDQRKRGHGATQRSVGCRLGIERSGTPDLLAVQVGVDAQTSLGFGRDGRAYVYTDLDAQRGRICVADPLDLRVEARQDLIRERTNSVRGLRNSRW